MSRYLKLYLYFVKFSFSKAMEFRMDFFFRVVMDIIFYGIQFMFFNIIYLHTPILAGWTLDQMTVFISAFIFVDAFHMTFFANNAWWFPISINRGDLDYYLIRPASSFFFMTLKEFAANSLINLLLTIGLLTWAISSYPGDLAAGNIFIFILFLINGAVLYFMCHLIFLMSVFWTQSDRGFSDVFYSAEKVAEKPDGIFQSYFRRFFVSILPFCLMASYPTRFLFDGLQTQPFLELIFGSVFIYIIVFFMWRKGLRGYSSASS